MKNEKCVSIAMIGPFPPPMHGMAAVNLAMKNFLVSKGENPEIFDTSSPTLGKTLGVRLARIGRILFELLAYMKMLSATREVSAYISVSGGYGKLYEIPFILLSRLRNAGIFLHHHSFLYVENPSFAARLLFLSAGRKARHITLCGTMAEKLKQHYPSISHVEVMSNAAVLSFDGVRPRIRNSLETLGFLGNIEADKGIFEFLDVLSSLKVEDARGLVAGPFRDSETERIVLQRMREMGNVRYVGPKYGSEKAEFFDSVDVLIYPTKNDAEPLTILEAMAQGLPVIANSRGCIQTMVDDIAGFVIGAEEDYAEKATDCLRVWLRNPSELTLKSEQAARRCREMRNESMEVMADLYAMMGLRMGKLTA